MIAHTDGLYTAPYYISIYTYVAVQVAASSTGCAPVKADIFTAYLVCFLANKPD